MACGDGGRVRHVRTLGIFARRPPVAVTKPSPAVKYRNLETGATWSGRGRMPKWLALAEEQGRGRDEFAPNRGLIEACREQAAAEPGYGNG